MICKSLPRTLQRCSTGVRSLTLLGLLGTIAACEVDSFMDPSVVGRWERTPVTLPILEQLDVIEDPQTGPQNVSAPTPQDHVPDNREYILGRGDMITLTVFELIHPGQEWVGTRRIDELGTIRLPIVGSVDAAGLSPSQLEQHVRQQLSEMDVLRQAQVAVIIQEARQNTFSVLGQPAQGGTAVGTYQIQRPDFRLLDALAMARGIPDRTRRIHIYRQVHMDQVNGPPQTPENGEPGPQPPQQEDPGDLIEQFLDNGNNDNNTQNPESTPATPHAHQSPAHQSHPGAHWVHVDGQWVSTDAPDQQENGEQLAHHRVIEIPYQQLISGDPNYNIIIRPGDVIRVPAPSAGFVYAMGEVSRPGAYTVPGEKELTVKQLVASAGNLSPTAIPERVDLIRRIGHNQEATVRINVRAIFDGTEPDFFLKPNDTLNFGTSFWATPLAIVRNGFRATYGFGFIVDRNFAVDIW